jgi:hypothetical protein
MKTRSKARKVQLLAKFPGALYLHVLGWASSTDLATVEACVQQRAPHIGEGLGWHAVEGHRWRLGSGYHNPSAPSHTSRLTPTPPLPPLPSPPPTPTGLVNDRLRFGMSWKELVRCSVAAGSGRLQGLAVELDPEAARLFRDELYYQEPAPKTRKQKECFTRSVGSMRLTHHGGRDQVLLCLTRTQGESSELHEVELYETVTRSSVVAVTAGSKRRRVAAETVTAFELVDSVTLPGPLPFLELGSVVPLPLSKSLSGQSWATIKSRVVHTFSAALGCIIYA